MIISIDLETYSSVDLKSAGMYKYVQSPDFEVLLFAYSIDGGAVTVVDLANGEKIPEELKYTILYAPNVTLHAYNAAFEWYCLSKYFMVDPVRFLNRWHCTMIHGLYCGMTTGLDATSKALGLPPDKQKMAEGKRLIAYFCKPCKPTKSNGGRTRNLPEHAPEKWNTFIEYNRQDVVTEMEIERRLSDFPVPDSVWEEWHRDMRSNLRGVAVDFHLIDGALYCNTAATEQMKAEAKALTGLDNPSSIAQLKPWLEQKIGAPIDNLQKQTVADLLELPDLPDDARRMLEIRRDSSKTSVKKYQAMVASACEDGRVRGMLQYYGANRTGRWCLTGDHEILTPDGWVRLDEWNGGRLLCWNVATEALSFQPGNALSFPYEGEMITYTGQRCAQVATPDHRMAVLDKNGAWECKTVQEIGAHRFTIPFTGYRSSGKSANPDHLRVLIMTQADGHYTENGDVRYGFKKQRKIARCKTLLRRCGIPFVEAEYEGPKTVITVKERFLPLWLRQFKNKVFGYWLLDESADVLFDELPEWDGYRCGPNSIQYTTVNEQNADVIQACALCAGLSATKIKKTHEKANWSDAHIVNIWLAPGHGTSIRREQVGRVQHSGRVYCAKTSTGFFAVRRNGKVWITGNSGRIVQVQNLPRMSLHGADVDEARRLVKLRDTESVKAKFGSVPGLLSQLIRTAFIPKAGCRFVDADFSAIEARVISWLAGEEWRLEVFRTHGKIYEASASAMFGVPMDRIVKGNPEYELRQKGKVSELALGYQGGTGALIQMGALRMGIPEEELPGLVRRWRKANPSIVRLWNRIEAAAMAVVNPQTGIKAARVDSLIFRYETSKYKNLHFLTIRLPSGRKLFYAEPKIGMNRFGNASIRYTGMEQSSKKWCHLETYGGKLTENIVQAIARDCLSVVLERLEHAGYNVVFHIHDEIVAEVPVENASLDDVTRIMSQPVEWAAGLPLGADGWVGDYFTKD